MAMNENDFNLLLRAKRQIHRESAIRSFLLAGVCVTAGLKLFGIDLPFITHYYSSFCLFHWYSILM